VLLRGGARELADFRQKNTQVAAIPDSSKKVTAIESAFIYQCSDFASYYHSVLTRDKTPQGIVLRRRNGSGSQCRTVFNFVSALL